ncbi:MAG: DNA polymerase Y family protein [Pseudomonadota bacterium]
MRIVAANPPAIARGIQPAMRLADARALVPDLATRTRDTRADQRLLERMADWSVRYTPHVALDGEEALWLDMTGATHLFGGEEAFLHDLSARLTRFGFAHRIAIASTPGTAHAAARHGVTQTDVQLGTQHGADEKSDAGYIIIPEGAEQRALDGLPVEALRLTREVVYMLHRFGLRTVSALRALPRSVLQRRFPSREIGDAVVHRLDQAFGLLPEPIVPRRPVPAYDVREPYPEPLLATESFSHGLKALLARLTADLERDARGATRLTFTAWHADGGVSRVGIATARASRDAAHLAFLFRERIEKLNPGFGVDVLGLSADAVEPLTGAQTSLGRAGYAASARGGAGTPLALSAAAAEDGGVAMLVDRLANKLGAEAVQRLVPQERHIPEAAEQRCTALEIPPGSPAPKGAGPRSPQPDKPCDVSREEKNFPRAPRPLHLLDMPEEVQVIAEVPEGPPRQFVWRRHVHRVKAAEGPERIAPEWWRLGAGRPGRWARPRDYYRVEDTEGRRFWMFRAGLYDEMGEPRDPASGPPSWHIHGMFP